VTGIWLHRKGFAGSPATVQLYPISKSGVNWRVNTLSMQKLGKLFLLNPEKYLATASPV
jgi:hypothetical protein